MRFAVSLGLCLASLMGCATYHDDLVRGQHYYDRNQFPDALAIWRILEIDWDSLTDAERARYAYLRGMTDYRMGFRADARHWLAVSKAVEQQHPGGLDEQSSAQLEQALSELNAAVYSMGPPTSASATGVELANVTTTTRALNLGAPVFAPLPVVQSAPSMPVAPAAPAAQPNSPPVIAPPSNAPAPSTQPAVTSPSAVPPPSGFPAP